MQGHKKVRESLQHSLSHELADGEEDDGSYNIIKKQFEKGERDAASDSQVRSLLVMHIHVPPLAPLSHAYNNIIMRVWNIH